MISKSILFSVVICILTIPNVLAAKSWPREIVTEKGAIISIYQPQLESMKGNVIASRMVVSLKRTKKDEPVFGVVFSESTISTDLDTRKVKLEGMKVKNMKFPDIVDQAKLTTLTAILEKEVPTWQIVLTIDEIIATLESNQGVGSENLNTEAPEIIYATKPSTLVLIDGEPKLKMDEGLKMEKVINTPFLIVKNSDSKYYLYAGKSWYKSDQIEKGWSQVAELPENMTAIALEIEKKSKEQAGQSGSSGVAEASPNSIIVRTKPAELIQTTNGPDFASVPGTALMYVTNTPDNIFKVIENQEYYILLSGRWFHAATLEGPWNYVASDKLPADFRKIPEGSDKDIVLASVAGTDAAMEAVQEAQIPQTAKVDRKTTKCTVAYDGEPKFESIEGTDLLVASNSSITVLRSFDKYYAVDNGVWFVSSAASGPWEVSVERPAGVDKIPPQNQAYNVKYVYVYDSTPEYVYVGYTPGYMGCYVYGPTVVYGTGFYYHPWYGNAYYPYPCTYGYGMCYNPYMGWSMGVTYATGMFMFGVAVGGFWGPPMYYPPYHHHGGGGYYGGAGRPGRPGGVGRPGIDNSLPGNNLYNNRCGVYAQPTRGAGNSPTAGNRMNGGGATAGTRDIQAPSRGSGASNNMYSDKAGNVYRNDKSGNWQQRSNNSWQNSSSSSRDQLNRSQQQRDRANTRTTQSSYHRSSGGYSGGSRGGMGGRGGGRR